LSTLGFWAWTLSKVVMTMNAVTVVTVMVVLSLY
jgi:hypothetical protein